MCRAALCTMLVSLTVTNAFAAASVDISVQGGTTGIVVYSGMADVCSSSGAGCATIEAGCEAALVSGAGVSALGDVEKASFIQENFPFAVNQSDLQADFQVATDLCNPFPPALREIRAIPGSPG